MTAGFKNDCLSAVGGIIYATSAFAQSVILAEQVASAGRAVGLFSSTGTPEGSVFASQSSLFFDTASGDIYVKTTSLLSNTGWVKLQTDTGVATSYATDSGTAVPSSGILNLLATTSSIVSAVGNTIFIPQGNVIGAASSTDNAISRFDGTTGLTLQNSLVTISDVGVVDGATQINVDNLRLDGNTLSSIATTVTLDPATTLVVSADNFSLTDPGRVDFTSTGTTDTDHVFNITTAASGEPRWLIVNNTSNTAGSKALVQVGVAGSTADDAYFVASVTGLQEYSFGVDNSDSDAFVISNTATLGTNNVFRASAAGEINLPLQPGFGAYFASTAANVTGNSTAYRFGNTDVGGGISMTEFFDQGGDFTAGASGGAFLTAPVSSKWYFYMSVLMQQATGATGLDFPFITSNTTFRGNNFAPNTILNSTNFGVNNSIVCVMDAADTCFAQISFGGVGADTADVYGGANDARSNFGGWQLG